MTNGILCDKYNCKELGINGKINKVMFSIHASNRETYEKVVKHGNFEKMYEKILSIKQTNPDADTTLLEREIERHIYDLYNLTPEEIAVVEGKDV